MLNKSQIFSGYSVNDIAKAKQFYSQTLGLEVEQNEMGLNLKFAGGSHVFLYPKNDHVPATFTVLNFIVDDIDSAAEELTGKGILLERYDNMHQDEKGIARGRTAGRGPDIAWFKDPAGNILSVLQN